MSVWTSEALDVHHDLAHLDCAREELDRWLLHEALRAQAAGSAPATVWTRPADPVVVAFSSIAPTQFARDDLPSRSLAGGYSVVPGYLVARLALTRSLHGQGLGTQLLLDDLSASSARDERRRTADRRRCPRRGRTPLLRTPRLPADPRLAPTGQKVATARAALGR